MESIDKKIKLRTPSKKRLFLGVLLGLLHAFAFYSFISILYGTFQLMQYALNLESGPPNQGGRFYDLFFALIAVILGQAVSFEFWYSLPNKVFGHSRKSFTRILSTQRVVNWFFLSWASKLSWTIMFLGAFSYFNSSLYYKFLCGLIVLVLWMQSWRIIRTAIGPKFKWVIYSGLIISLLSFGLSQVKLIADKINNIIISDNIVHAYSLEIPESSHIESLQEKSVFEIIYIVRKKDSESNDPIIIYNNKTISFEEFIASFGVHSYSILPTLQIYVDKHIKMDIIFQLEQFLSSKGYSRIAYTVRPKNSVNSKRLCQKTVLHVRAISLPDFYKNTNVPPPPPPVLFPEFRDSIELVDFLVDLRRDQHIIQIKPNDIHSAIINNRKIDLTQITNSLETDYSKEKNMLIEFYPSVDMTFGEYIIITAQVRQMTQNIRARYKQKTGKPHRLTWEEKVEMEKKIKLSYLPIPPDMVKYLH